MLLRRSICNVFLCAALALFEAPFAESQERLYGTYLSIFGDPYPSDLGINIAKNLSGRLRLSLGYAWPNQWVENDETGKTSSVGASMKYKIMGTEPVSLQLSAGLTYVWIHENRSPISNSNGFAIPVGFEILFQRRDGLEYSGGFKSTVYPRQFLSPSFHIGFFF